MKKMHYGDYGSSHKMKKGKGMSYGSKKSILKGPGTALVPKRKT